MRNSGLTPREEREMVEELIKGIKALIDDVERQYKLSLFLKTIKSMNYISSSLVRKLAIRFNCAPHILRFLIDSKSHSDDYFNNEDN